MTQPLRERLEAMAHKYAFECGANLTREEIVRSIAADAMWMCAKELGYDSMEAARTALFPARKSFTEQLNLGRRRIDLEDDQRGI